jgi:hypothetical protein
MPCRTLRQEAAMQHYRLNCLLAGLLLALAASALPARAQAESNALLDWVEQIYGAAETAPALEELMPAGWPVPVYLPADGELLVSGEPGAAEGGLAAEDDFQWALADEAANASAGSGRAYMINATHFEFEPETFDDSTWGKFDQMFQAQLTADTPAAILGTDPDVELAGLRWMVYRLQEGDGGDPEQPIDYVFALHLTDGAVYMLGLFMYAAPEGALDAALAELLQGPATPDAG